MENNNWNNNWNNWNNWNKWNEPHNPEPETADSLNSETMARESAAPFGFDNMTAAEHEAAAPYVDERETAELYAETSGESFVNNQLNSAMDGELSSRLNSELGGESDSTTGVNSHGTTGASRYGGNNHGETPRRKKDVKYVTRRGMVIALICTMIATSGLTVGGLALGGAFNRTTIENTTHTISPTNFNIADATNSQKSIQEIVAMNENAVVEITTESVVTDFWIQNYITQGAGSGVLISSDGYILTCNHVIKDAATISVSTKNGAQYTASVVGSNEQLDVAVIKIKGSDFAYATFGDSDSLSIGDMGVVIGNPLGKLGGSASAGIISALNRNVNVEGKSMTLLQTDASINPGNSGGGLFDGAGNLVGIVVAKADDSSVEGIGFAIPINQASVIANSIIENSKRPIIGIMIVDVTSEIAAQQYGVDALGLYIDEVTGDNAKAAGFMAGDIITSVDGIEIRNASDLTVELSKKKAGDTVTVTVLRDGETISLDTVLQESEL